VGALPTAARLARAFTLTIVAGWGLSSLADDCELVTGELVANVVQAATAADGMPWYDDRGRLPLLWVRLLSDGVRLRVEVWDNLPLAVGVPEQRHPTRTEESGRGLGIVRELSQDWGWDHIPGHAAKRVWALLEKSLCRKPRPGATTRCTHALVISYASRAALPAAWPEPPAPRVPQAPRAAPHFPESFTLAETFPVGAWRSFRDRKSIRDNWGSQGVWFT
jgi:hypothetical protein